MIILLAALHATYAVMSHQHFMRARDGCVDPMADLARIYHYLRTV